MEVSLKGQQIALNQQVHERRKEGKEASSLSRVSRALLKGTSGPGASKKEVRLRAGSPGRPPGGWQARPNQSPGQSRGWADGWQGRQVQ